MKLPCGTVAESPEDATIVALDDPDARDFWAGWFNAKVEEIELAIATVGPNQDHIEEYLVGRKA
jgi:hypothetical protein